jgi:hypothetical protein
MRYFSSLGHIIRWWLVLALALILREPWGYDVAAHAVHGGVNSVCPGFVILPNGRAVWSRAEATASHAHHGAESKDQTMTRMDGGHDGHQEHMHGGHAESASHHETHGKQQTSTQTRDHGHDHTAHDHHGSNGQKSYQHGQPVKLETGMLCVPVGSPKDTAWMAVSQTAPFWVRAESIRGPLTHNSRANEALRFVIIPKDGGQVPELADLRLWVRMPQHDHGMPGGHGPANDPDVKGLPINLDDAGNYVVSTIDFSMAGPWLFEVQVRQGDQTTKAYFGADVGEE